MRSLKSKNVTSSIDFPHFRIPVEQNIGILGTPRKTKQDVFEKSA